MRITVDGRSVTAAPGDSILEAARRGGVVIPTLCYHPDLSVDGSCRLCVVEVEGAPWPIVACAARAVSGMVVRTETPGLAETRRTVLELLLRRHADAGAGERPETELDHWAARYGARRTPDRPAARHPVDADPSPFIRVDLNLCILCTRCVRACREIQCRFVWGVGDRGDGARIVAGLDTSMQQARCESCGACVAYCPTGALSDRMAHGLGRPDRVVSTVCGYCGVGCGLDLNVKAGRIIGVTASPAAPVNGMALCVKGRYGYDFVHHEERLVHPRVRQYLLDGGTKQPISPAAWAWVDVDWETALGLVATRLAAIKSESGPDAIGVLASAKCTNEENYLMQKLARQVIGTHNVDHCARLCHSSTVAGLAMAFGSGAMSNSMDDIVEHARAILVIGSNVTEQHPVFGTMIRRAVLRRGVRVVVADPRRIELAEFAELHLQQHPGTDVALLNGLMHIILERDWHDAAFIAERCEEFDAFRATLLRYPPEKVAAVTGVPVADLHAAAELLAREKPMAVVWAMGITQHTTGVLNVLSLANLQMLLGNMGVPGGGVNPLRGQNNVQGACDMGGLPNVLPGYQPVADAAARAKFDAAWATAPRSQPLGGNPGLTVTEMVGAFGERRVRALYVLGEDLAMTEPDLNHARASLAAGELLVLQEIFPSETAAFADVLLPGATFAEKAGTFTNTERRVQLLRAALSPPGDARGDWAITAELARRLLAREGRRPAGPDAGWGYAAPPEILQEVARLTPSYAGVSHARLETGARLQWPVPSASHAGTPILHVGRFTRGRGRFHPVDHLAPAEQPSADFPLVLTTGRVLYHWHGGELSRRARGLLLAYSEPLTEISPEDAGRLGLADGHLVRVRSRRGEMIARAWITDRVPAGVVFGTFHFPGPANVNNVTIDALDPVARIPEYKVCAVALEPAGSR